MSPWYGAITKQPGNPGAGVRNMKVEWEADDIRPGIRVCKPGCNEVLLVGYDAAVHSRASPALAVISLSDGMICETGRSPQEIADFLNKSGEQPLALVVPTR
jgi:hypothetical protein